MKRYVSRSVLQSIVFVLPLLAVVLWSSLVTVRNSVVAPAVRPKQIASQSLIFPRADYAALAQQHHAVGSDFATFYAGNQGKQWLGDAITPELPTATGQLQVYQGGELTIANTLHAPVLSVAVVPTLIQAGAEETLASDVSTLTYAALQSLSGDQSLVEPPWWWHDGDDPATNGVFIPQDATTDAGLGHYVPALFATYLTKLSSTWPTLVGQPVTEAQAGTIWLNELPHRIVAQAFDRAVLYLDRDASDTPQVTLQHVGADYLAIFGPPALNGTNGRPVWATGAPTAVYPAPDLGKPFANFFANFPATLTGDSVWLGGVLWYQIGWKTLTTQNTGWVSADSLSFLPPPAGVATADLGALSPRLGAYVQGLGDDAAVAVYVPDQQAYFIYNPNQQAKMASTFKVPILLTLLSQVEAQGRTLTGDEMALAQNMIENSDNDAATALYQEINYNIGIIQFMDQADIAGLAINGDAFGDSVITPTAMTQLLTALWSGRILSAPDRTYALGLMEHVRGDEQMGVGQTAPTGALVAMKDGWITDDDGTWITNSVGIVSVNGHTYMISVYVHNHADINAGWQVVNAISGDVAHALTGSST